MCVCACDENDMVGGTADELSCGSSADKMTRAQLIVSLLICGLMGGSHAATKATVA